MKDGRNGDRRVALVTGSARGIGRAIAVALANSGHSIVAHQYGTPPEDMEKTLELLGSSGAPVMVVEGDLTDDDAVRGAIVQQAVSKFGRLDILVNNAGLNEVVDYQEIDAAAWVRVMNANTLTCFLCAREAAPIMVEQRWGRIVNLASAAAFVPGTDKTGLGGAHYLAAKGAISALTRALARRLAPYVTVNAIAPGAIATERALSLRTREETAKLESLIPVRRMGRPEEIGALVAYLASDASGFMTGQTIHINGGTYFG